ncbi:MAG: hypothetical protein RLY87_961 [Chloroflexota bacterium]|jgi:AcrR family transcriptional regulator
MPKQTWTKLDEHKRDRIIQEALTEFAQYPYAQASITAMVRRLGIAKGSVYQYFEDKEDLYVAMVHIAHERVHVALRTRIPLALYREADVFTLLRRYFAESVSVSLDYPVEAALIQRSLYDTSPSAPAVRALADHIQRSFVEEVVSSAIQSRSLRDDVDTRVSVFVLESVLARMIPYMQMHIASDAHATEQEVTQSAAQIVRFFDDLVAVLNSGLQARPRERSS